MDNTHIITTCMHMCVCIAKQKHVYMLSKQTTAFIFELMNVRMKKKTVMKHCMAMHCNILTLRLIAYNSKTTQCIQSKANASIAMLYISTP